ncbi:MAG TPA: DNA-directed RNA polymerase subunit omega [Blastocatellia bacterium]|nr:DNA-directed RNA polymerase subunit omega [Blastocatellia bacterium]
MANEPNEETWTNEIDSKYRLVLLAAKRSKQLQRGAKQRVHTTAKKPIRIALEEVKRGLVLYQSTNK